MSGSIRLYVLAAGLAGLCLAAASAGERVMVNETVLDCVPEGCFVVRYVPEEASKPERKSDQSSTSGTDDPTEEARETYPEIILSGTRSEAPVDHPRAAEKSDYSYDNLQANLWIRNWTGIAAVLTGAGVVLIWWTLRETQKGTGAALKAAEHSFELLKAEKIMKAARIEVQSTSVDVAKTGVIFSVQVKNTGDSKAFCVHPYVFWRGSSFYQDVKFRNETDITTTAYSRVRDSGIRKAKAVPISEPIFGISIDPGKEETLSLPREKLDDIEIAILERGALDIQATFLVMYWDIFEDVGYSETDWLTTGGASLGINEMTGGINVWYRVLVEGRTTDWLTIEEAERQRTERQNKK